MALEISLDESVCGGTGECALLLPEVFELTSECRGRVISTAKLPDLATLLEVAWRCPTSAIAIFEDGVALDPQPS